MQWNDVTKNQNKPKMTPKNGQWFNCFDAQGTYVTLLTHVTSFYFITTCFHLIWKLDDVTFSLYILLARARFRCVSWKKRCCCRRRLRVGKKVLETFSVSSSEFDHASSFSDCFAKDSSEWVLAKCKEIQCKKWSASESVKELVENKMASGNWWSVFLTRVQFN